MSCGVGHRCGLDLALLSLWCRPAATALIGPLAWEPPYATGVALKRQKKVIFDCLLWLSHFWGQKNTWDNFFFCLFRGEPRHMDVPKGLIRAVAAGLRHSLSNAGIRAASVTYTTAHGSARSLIHWVGPGIKPVSLWLLVRFISNEPQWELHMK